MRRIIFLLFIFSILLNAQELYPTIEIKVLPNNQCVFTINNTTDHVIKLYYDTSIGYFNKTSLDFYNNNSLKENEYFINPLFFDKGIEQNIDIVTKIPTYPRYLNTESMKIDITEKDISPIIIQPNTSYTDTLSLSHYKEGETEKEWENKPISWQGSSFIFKRNHNYEVQLKLYSLKNTVYSNKEFFKTD